jgi:hypothetical protein
MEFPIAAVAPRSSDGVVPNRSQVYPGAPRREIIENADSHDAAKKSVDKTIRRIKQVIYDEQWARTVNGARP